MENIIKSIIIWFKTDSKKKKSNMYNDQEDAYVQQVKQQYFGKYFQWVRPINQEKVGEVVRCTNVRRKGEKGPIVVEFNAGSAVSIDLLQSYLTPYSSDGIIEPPAASEVVSGGQGIQENQTTQNTNAAKNTIKPAAPDKMEMFKMFSKSDMNLDLTLNVKMPDIALIKMMYNNAENKDKFLSELSEYMLKQITTETIKHAFSKIVIDTNDVVVVVPEDMEKK